MSYANGPRIVTDGLVLHLDAANRKSYAGSGTVWTDLSGNSNNGTLVNGPTFSSANAGILVFDGSNDYISTNIDLTDYINYTISIFFKIDPAVSARDIIYGQDQTGDRVRTLEYDPNIATKLYSYNGDNSMIVEPNAQKNVWYNVSIIQDNTMHYSFVNGLYKSSASKGTVRTSSNQTFLVGKRIYTGNEQPFNGEIPIVSIYNRALSANEVQQNYNALKGRYGLS